MDPADAVRDRRKRRRIAAVAAVPTLFIAVGLWFAEAETLLVGRLSVWAGNHLLAALAIAVVSALVLVGVGLWVRGQLIRRMSPSGKRGFFDALGAWVAEAPDEAAIRREQANKEALRHRTAKVSAPTAAIIASVAVAVISSGAYLVVSNSAAAPGPNSAGCSGIACATSGSRHLVVVSFQANYRPKDLTPVLRSVEDGGIPPFGYRFVRVVVTLGGQTPSKGELSKEFALVQAGRHYAPGAVGYDPACQLSKAAPGKIPLCFQPKVVHTGQVVLDWMAGNKMLKL